MSQRLALAHLGADIAAELSAGFALDQRLAQIVSSANEVMLAQMRIAWWRDMLKQAPEDRPIGDAVLAQIGAHWAGREDALIRLIDAWEQILVHERLDQAAIQQISADRSAFLAAVIQRYDAEIGDQRAMVIAQRWALADLAAHCSSAAERQAIIEIGQKLPPYRRLLPRKLRGIAVLDALAGHSLKCGGRPLADGRMAALVALRAGLIGR